MKLGISRGLAWRDMERFEGRSEEREGFKYSLDGTVGSEDKGDGDGLGVITMGKRSDFSA